MSGNQKRGDLTRDRILRSAMNMFGTKGYSDTGLLQIAKKAKVTTGAIYYHFGDKRGLFEAVALQVGQDIRGKIIECVGDVRPDFTFAEGAILSAIAVCADSNIQQIITRDAPMLFSRQEWRRIELQGSYGIMKALFFEMKKSDLLKTSNPDVLAALCLSLVLEAAAEVEQSDDKTKTLKQAQSIVRNMFRPFKG